jgi:hypothetical protein
VCTKTAIGRAEDAPFCRPMKSGYADIVGACGVLCSARFHVRVTSPCFFLLHLFPPSKVGPTAVTLPAAFVFEASKFEHHHVFFPY